MIYLFVRPPQTENINPRCRGTSHKQQVRGLPPLKLASLPLEFPGLVDKLLVLSIYFGTQVSPLAPPRWLYVISRCPSTPPSPRRISVMCVPRLLLLLPLGGRDRHHHHHHNTTTNVDNDDDNSIVNVFGYKLKDSIAREAKRTTTHVQGSEG